MKLYATTSNEKGKEQGMGGGEYINISFRVKNQKIGSVELYLFDDDVRNGDDENEWLLRFWKNPKDDPIILTQGHILSTLKQKVKKQKGEEWDSHRRNTPFCAKCGGDCDFDDDGNLVK